MSRASAPDAACRHQTQEPLLSSSPGLWHTTCPEQLVHATPQHSRPVTVAVCSYRHTAYCLQLRAISAAASAAAAPAHGHRPAPAAACCCRLSSCRLLQRATRACQSHARLHPPQRHAAPGTAAPAANSQNTPQSEVQPAARHQHTLQLHTGASQLKHTCGNMQSCASASRGSRPALPQCNSSSQHIIKQALRRTWAGTLATSILSTYRQLSRLAPSIAGLPCQTSSQPS